MGKGRKSKKKKEIGEGKWIYEIGEEIVSPSTETLITPSNTNVGEFNQQKKFNFLATFFEKGHRKILRVSNQKPILSRKRIFGGS